MGADVVICMHPHFYVRGNGIFVFDLSQSSMSGPFSSLPRDGCLPASDGVTSIAM